MKKMNDLKGNSHACVLLGIKGVSDVIRTPVSWKLGENAVWNEREREKTLFKLKQINMQFDLHFIG